MKHLLLGLTVLGLLATAAAAAEYPAGNLTIVGHADLGAPAPMSTEVGVVEYSNVSSFLGAGFAQGPSANISGNQITRCLMDDITPTGANPGLSVTQVKFSVANFNAVAVSCRARLRFWFADGPGGIPGTYYNNIGFTFNPLSFSPGVTLVTGTIGPGLFPMPSGAFWAGIVFDNNTGATGATAAQMDNMGQGIFSPPTVGSSADVFFMTTDAGSFFPVSNPIGATGNFGGSPPADFGWEFTVDVPVPARASSWGRIKTMYR